MKKIFKFLSAFLVLSSISGLASEAIAQERNVKSSCSLMSTSGVEHTYETRGRCVIKTYVEGDYIVVEVKTPWDSVVKGKPDSMRLVNSSTCTFWQHGSNDCRGEFWYGDSWSYVVAGESLHNGKIKFNYSVGNAYMVTYDGPLPRP